MTLEQMNKKLEELRQGLAEIEAQRLRQEGALLMMQQLIADEENEKVES